MKQLGVAAASVAGASTLAACPKTDDSRPIEPAEIPPVDASFDRGAYDFDAGNAIDASDASDGIDASPDAGRRRRRRDRDAGKASAEDAGHSYAPRPPPSGYMVVDMLPPPVQRQKPN